MKKRVFSTKGFVLDIVLLLYLLKNQPRVYSGCVCVIVFTQQTGKQKKQDRGLRDDNIKSIISGIKGLHRLKKG